MNPDRQGARVDERPILVIAGVTGTGKSDVAVAVAERIGGEIVGCDSLQVYRGFDRGTAKPGADPRRRVPHHLVDFADPTRRFTLAEYVSLADACIEQIRERERVPMVVGGTGLYLRGLLRGIVTAPRPDETLRQRLLKVAARRGTISLHRWLERVDPESAARIAPTDGQRLRRALELALTEGPSWSDRLREAGTWSSDAERYRALKFGLDLDREVLRDRLDRRVDRFLENGLVDEVRSLLAAGVPDDVNAFKAIGYREILAAIREGADPQTCRPRIQANTRRYAKRQRTWFRAEPGLIWVDAGEGIGAVADRIVSAWHHGTAANAGT